MSILDDVLNEEYDRIENVLNKINEEIEELPHGYISKKKINKNEYYYLQKRVGDTVSSKYIEKDKVASYRLLIQHRKELEDQKKKLLAEQKKIIKAISGRI